MLNLNSYLCLPIARVPTSLRMPTQSAIPECVAYPNTIMIAETVIFTIMNTIMIVDFIWIAI